MYSESPFDDALKKTLRLYLVSLGLVHLVVSRQCARDVARARLPTLVRYKKITHLHALAHALLDDTRTRARYSTHAQ